MAAAKQTAEAGAVAGVANDTDKVQREIPPAKTLLAAISAIMAEVGTVAKRGKNAFHNYEYATASDILHQVQPLMAKHGLVIFQTEKSHEVIQEGTAMAFTYEFTLAHSSGEVWTEKPLQTGVATSKNSKGGFDDKVANKCHTAARKYFILALFQIPTGDYPDPDADEGPQQGKAQTNGNTNTNANANANGSKDKPAGNGQQKQQASQSNGKGQQQTAKTVDIVNPGTGEIVKFEKRSLWLNFLEAKLNHSDAALEWFDMNQKTFETMAAAMAEGPGKEHCDRIKRLVADLKKAALDPVNTSGALDNDEPDYSSAP
jgi:hypothetical protein